MGEPIGCTRPPRVRRVSRSQIRMLTSGAFRVRRNSYRVPVGIPTGSYSIHRRNFATRSRVSSTRLASA